MGMENVPVNLLVLEELSHGTEDGKFVPESVCGSRRLFCVCFDLRCGCCLVVSNVL